MGMPLSVLRLSVFSFWIGLALAGASCTNNRIVGKTTKLSASANSLEGVITGAESTLVLSRVVKNTQQPTAIFDLLGDGSGSLGQNCVAGGDKPTNQGVSSCNCVFEYAKADGSNERYEAPTLYHEGDLIRCLYTGIPAAVSSVKVRVHVTSSDLYSNEITFKFSGTGISLDTASASTFVRADRYQCRDLVKVPYVFDPNNMYDPFQSEDPSYTYPLNYYTTNFGGTMAIYAGGLPGLTPPTFRDCPTVLANDPSTRGSVTSDPTTGLDFTIYSVAADSSGSKRIYPATGSAFDRSTFYLARKPTGIFNVPVNAYIAPDIYTISPDEKGNQAGVPPLGYAALPIPTGVAGRETCPDSSIAIPSGYQWVKVWLFRMALQPRKFVSSYQFQLLGNVSCSPGEWTNGAGVPRNDPSGYLRSVFPDCHHDAANASFNKGASDLTQILGTPAPGLPMGSFGLASRMLEGTGMCVNMEPDLNLVGGIATAGPGRYTGTSVPTWTDLWEPNSVDPNFACGKASDPAKLCVNPKNIPHDPAAQAFALDHPSDSRFDFLFVVSPATVMSGDMANSAPSTLPYKPYRFMSPGDCNSPDPDAPLAAGDCKAERALRNYGIKFHDVSSAGDPPADDPKRPGAFPVCALQPK